MVKGGSVEINKAVTIGDKTVTYSVALGTEEISYASLIGFALWVLERLVEQDSKEKKEDNSGGKSQAYT